jgi:cyclophilin family peptidyl-prolyl cis-trans isomerase
MKKLFIVSVILLAFGLSRQAVAKQPPFNLPQKGEVLKIRSAILETSQGRIFIELFPEEAPWHVANFKYLADKGFYKNLSFFIYKPDYLIQAGDPQGTGKGGPGYDLPAEFSARHHTRGTLGMARKPDIDARSGKRANPERRSNGSQFHILLGDAPHMDGEYTIFGKVVGGFDALERLRRGDRIVKLTVFIREGGR